jgi:hypothetical protein
MAINRYPTYFRPEDSSIWGSGMPSDRLMRVELSVFPDTLKKIVRELLADDHPIAISRFCDQLIVPCFNRFNSPGFAYEDFSGDEMVANHAMRAAAAFYAIGWERLNVNARSWCRTMLECHIPAEIQHPARKDVANAKIFVGFAVNYVNASFARVSKSVPNLQAADH